MMEESVTETVEHKTLMQIFKNVSSKLYHWEFKDKKANNVDPDEAAQNELPHLDTYCFQFQPLTFLGPVVQSIVSLTSLLRGQLIKCFMTL